MTTSKKPKPDAQITALVAQTGVDLPALASYASQSSGLLAFLSGAPCVTPQAETWFSEQLSSVRGLLKVLEEKRTSLTSPLLQAKKNIDALFAPANQPLKECEAVIRAKLETAAQSRLEAATVARLAAQTAAMAGDAEGVLTALAAVPVAVETAGSSTTYRWVASEFIVSLLPEEYLLANVAAIDAAGLAAKNGPAPAIPGVTFVQKAFIRAKAV